MLLCKADRVVTTDRLIEQLWGEEPPQSATKLIQGYVSRLRRLLGEGSAQMVVTHVNGYQAYGYELIVEPGDIDVHHFEDLVDSGQKALSEGELEEAVARFDEALKLWRGRPFADVPSTPVVDTEAARLQASSLRAKEAWIQVQLTCGHHDDAISELETLVAENPLRESLRGQLMLGYYRSSRQADALVVYQDLRRTLIDELGVEPSPPLQRLQQQILSAEPSLLLPEHTGSSPSPPPIVPRQLPHHGIVFAGRESELATLRTLLGDESRGAAVVAIDGLAGVGKSALAIEVAHQIANRFPDGQLFVDLHGSTAGAVPLKPTEVLGRFLHAFGADEHSSAANLSELSARFRTLVADRRVLIVLDNAEDADQVRSLVPAGQGCAVLITCRMTIPSNPYHLDVLPSGQAMALLRRLVGDERIDAEADAAAEIVAHCEGIPLALRSVGMRLAARPAWPLRVVAARLANTTSRLDLLRFAHLDVRSRLLTSYLVLTRSDRTVDIEAARTFRLLGVMPTSEVDVSMAATLVDVAEGRAEKALDRLVDVRLLESPCPGRYEMGDLVRSFAHELAGAEEQEADRQAALQRVQQHQGTSARERHEDVSPSR